MNLNAVNSNSELLINYLQNNLEGNEKEKVVKLINAFEDLAKQKFTEKDWSSFNLNEWKIEKLNAKQLKENLKTYKCDAFVSLKNLDSNFPFEIKLSLTSKYVNICVYNKFSEIYFDNRLVEISPIRKENKQEELLNYLNKDKIFSKFRKIDTVELVSYKESQDKYNQEDLYDLNNKKLTSTMSKLISYLYAQIRNNSIHLLSSEPIKWNIPKVVVNKISSGLADSLQDNLDNYFGINKSEKIYNNFLKNYPSINDFAKSFDIRYMS